jgi:murein DD-endopeptidase MepM/ murein hydrolase activator NlpD
MWRLLILALIVLMFGLIGSAFWMVISDKQAHEQSFAHPEVPKEDSRLPNVSADPPLRLTLPVACAPGEDCWIVNYVDRDPGPGRADFMCLDMSYDGHKGTDFAVAHTGLLDTNVPVLAAAPGKVVGVRDDMADISFREIGREAIRGRECGNGVRIDHGNDWATQYCHLKRGSVLVQAGQTVERGQVLGSIGLSGLTEFPHVHIAVSRGSEIVDPFVGRNGGPKCGPGAVPLWDAELGEVLRYRAPKLLDLGLAARSVEHEEAETGALARVSRLPANGEALVVWMRMAGTREGDTARITIDGPDGSVFTNDWTAERTRLIQFQFMGKRTPDGGWTPGRYTGRVVLMRDGTVTADRSVSVEVR